MKWNAKMNLTSIRNPEEIVTRHFGESLAAASVLVPPGSEMDVIDVGSGAGFPGLPIKIMRPGVRSVLIESQIKKVTFLREVVRALGLSGVEVYYGRAEQFPRQADLVTFRAVEKFESVLGVASTLVRPGGRLAMLVGESQVETAKSLLPGEWSDPMPLPNSYGRVIAAWTEASAE